MKKVMSLKFAVSVALIGRNNSSLEFYNARLKEHEHFHVFYDGSDFLIINTAKTEGTRKVYVAKTNVSQWELEDSNDTAKEDTKGVSKAVRK